MYTLVTPLDQPHIKHQICVGHLLIAGTNGQRGSYYHMCDKRSPTLTWRSNEYIEAVGNSLTLVSFNEPGHTVPSPVNMDTNATLVSKSIENGEQVLVSQLCIVTLAIFSTASITCLYGDGSMNSTGVQVLGKVYAMYILH